MDANNGALHFDSDIDDKKYNAKLLSMESRANAFRDKIISGNAAIEQSYRSLAGAISGGAIKQNFNDIAGAINNPSIINGLRAIEARFERLGKIAANGTRGAVQGITDVNNSVNASANQMQSTFSKMGVALGAYFSLQQLYNFGGELIKVRGQFQQIQVAYTTILGSGKAANDLFQQSIALAKETPFSLIDVATSTKQLLAYGFEVKDVTATVAKLGNIAAGVSAPLQDIAYLYGTLKTQGRAYAMDIRQFTGRGIPIIDELAKQFKTTTTEVNALVEAGKVGFPEVEKAFTALTSEGGQFFNMIQEQSKTIPGQISNLGDNFDQLLNKIGKDNDGLIKGGIAGLNSLIDNYQNVIDIVKGLIVVYGAYRAALIVLNASNIAFTATMALETIAYRLLRDGLAVLNTEMILAGASTAALTAVFAAIIGVIIILNEQTDTYKITLESLAEINKNAIRDTQIQVDKIESLSRSLKNLTFSETDRLAVVTKLREVMGKRLDQYTDEQILAGKAEGAIRSYTAALVDNARAAAAQSKIQDIESELINTDPTLQAGDTKKDRNLAAFRNIPLLTRSKLQITKGSFISSDVSGEVVVEYRKMLEQQKKGILKVYAQKIDEINVGIDRTNNDPKIKAALAFQALLKDVTKNFDALMKTSTGKKDFEAIQKALGDALDMPGISDKQIQKIKNDQAKVQGALSKYSLKNDVKTGLDTESEFEKRTGIYKKLSDLEAKRVADAKTANDKEVDDVKAKYNEILAEVDKYNRDSRNKTKIPKEFVAKVTAASKSEVDQVVAKQTIEQTKNDIAAQKDIFDEYEKYKQQVGKTEADKRFKNDLQGAADFVGYLRGILSGLDGKTDAYSNSLRDLLSKSIPKAENDAAKAAQENYTKVLIDTQSFNEQLDRLTETYLANRANLISDGRYNQAEEYDKIHNEEVKKLYDANAKKLEAYKDLFLGIDELNNAQAETVISNAEKMLQELAKNGNISKELLAQIRAAIKATKNEFNMRTPEGLRNIASSIGGIADGIGNIDAALGGVLRTLSNVIQGFADVKSNLNTIQTAKGAGSGFAKLTAGLGIIGTVVSIIPAIVGLFSNAKAKAEQLAYSQDLQLKQTEAINKALERQLALNKDIYGTQRLSAYVKTLGDIKKAQADANAALSGRFTLTDNKEINAEIEKRNRGEKGSRFLDPIIEQVRALGLSTNVAGKSLEELQLLLDQGKLDESTGALVRSLVALRDQYNDTMNALNAESVGSTFESQLSNIVSLFENATVTAEDFANNFQKIIQQSVINSFKRQFLEQQLQGFYSKFAEFTSATSGGALDQSEITTLQGMYDEILKKAKAGFEDIQKATGVKFGDGNVASDPNSLSGQIQRNITEDTAQVLEGLFRGFFELSKKIYAAGLDNNVTLKQQLQLMGQCLAVQMEIRDYTGRIAVSSESMDILLKSIDKNIAANASALGATGRKI